MIDKYLEFEYKFGPLIETHYEDAFFTWLLDSGTYLQVKNLEVQKKIYLNGKYRYRVDFLLETLDGRKIAIEIDGKHHQEDEHQVAYDIKRTNELNKLGFEVRRFQNSEVKDFNVDWA